MTAAKTRLFMLLLSVFGCLFLVAYAWAQASAQPTDDSAAKLLKGGNWKEAYNAYSKLTLDKEADPAKVSGYLTNGVQCLQRLGRMNEYDAFIEKAVETHGKNWRLLQTAANSYLNTEHYGFVISGAFERGGHRGGGKQVQSYERDRVRALQLMQQAMEATNTEKDKAAVGQFHLDFAQMLMGNRGYSEAWRLQYLTDLTVLPDYEEGYYYGGYGRGWGGSSRGAPVGEDGKPVYHYQPKSWKEAKSDGERWRWCLAQAMEYAAGRTGEIRFLFASFLHNQFGVQTMADYGWYFGRMRAAQDDDTRKDESGAYELHTLTDGETIAKLANGIKRFNLPDEFNYIKIFRELAETKSYSYQPREMLAQIYENRRQYPTAAEQWRLCIQEYGAGDKEYRQQRLNQIIGNWGLFEPILTQPAGDKGASVEFRFRNGKKLSLEATEIDVKTLLEDVKAYLKGSPKQLDWQQVDLENVGYRLVEKNQTKYLLKNVEKWDLELKPLANHFDRRITVGTPLKKAGAYLLVARMDTGNVSRVVIWIADTAIVEKPLDNAVMYYVADAVKGSPIAKANLEFFGYRQKWVPAGRSGGSYSIETQNFAEFADANGMLITGRGAGKAPEPAVPNAADVVNGGKMNLDPNYQWVIIATTPADQGGRLAYLGFRGVWFNPRYDAEYNQVKVFVMTDRPVYRPGNPVKFKFWVNTAKYDKEDKSEFAGRTFTVQVNDPKGEKVLEKQFKADEYGGFDGEVTLGKEATLGVYQVFLPSDKNGNNVGGGGSFRLEEYKKPEFEVKVDAPAEPVMLGEKIAAKVTAKYYFGAPVTEAKVKYKVLRSSHSADWYPICYWDWFYGPGYWWFAYDYVWYPGWREWGCKRPMPVWWWQWHPRQQPEVVAEGDAQLDKDGSFKVEIDTSLAKAVHGDTDHKYEITAEVTDKSRRTIVGTGTVLVARKPFKVYAWVDRGHYRAGDVVHASFNAHTLDNKPVKGTGELKLLKVSYNKDAKGNPQPVEKVVEEWNLPTNEEGVSQQQIKAAAPGQYRVSYKVTDVKNHAIEGGYVFAVMGEGLVADEGNFRFNDIELVQDKKEYKPGEKVKLMVNTDQADSTVLLFVRPANGVYLAPKMLRLKGKSVGEEIEVIKRDMPNFFIEGLTVSGGKVYTDSKEIVVPPENRVLDVKVTPSATEYKPGAKATMTVKLTDPNGEPFSGSTVVAVYDKAVEYISGGSNVPAIKEFFWKWRRHHNPQTETSLSKGGYNILKSKEVGMGFLGVFGASVADEEGALGAEEKQQGGGPGGGRGGYGGERRMAAAKGGMAPGAPMPTGAAPESGELADRDGANALRADDKSKEEGKPGDAGGEGPAMAQPTVRTQFADTALWVAALQTNEKGEATVELTMPENLTTWKARVWAMGAGTKVGEGAVEVVTTKNLIVRLQAPRFFVQKDEVVISANVHNYLKAKKAVKAQLELEGGTLELIKSEAPGAGALSRDVNVDAGGEARVDWRVKVLQPGNAVVRVKALTDEESDAMQMEFPVFIHGMLKMDSFCGVIRPDKNEASVTVKVPAERLPEQSRLEVRYSPTLAGAMVDALPYMVDYPYGCTEQTLNRFLPTVITHKVLLRMGLDLKDIQQKRTNLNAQEIGDDKERAKDWSFRGGYMSRGTATVKEPVFDPAEVQAMVKAGLERLAAMQCSDGGWGWFSGWGEQSYPHTTAVVVHGLQIARDNDVAVVPGMIQRGVDWLKSYQARQVQMIKNAPTKTRPWKEKADSLDAFVYMVLIDEKVNNQEMQDFLYRDKNDLAVYAKAMFGLALHKLLPLPLGEGRGEGAPRNPLADKRDELIRNVEQYLVQDAENQSAYLKLPENNYWWCWYGSENEAMAYYLKLLAATDAKGDKASQLVKYLINNRKHASYWNSTRDTAYVVEAFADFIKASGEDKPDMTLVVSLDGKQVKEVKIDGSNIFSFDNKFVLAGKDVTSGDHKVTLSRKGTGPVYFNAYLTNFTLEDPIKSAGLEIKVQRKFYKLVAVDKTVKVEGQRGQALDQKVEKYERRPLADGDTLKSGDLVEIEMTIESKNDYEYIMFEDMKAAGFEPVEVRSGYNNNDMRAYMELRDERVTFFVRQLARGNHSVAYRMRAEIPGKFSALPTKASAMYAPELKANSDEFKVGITD